MSRFRARSPVRRRSPSPVRFKEKYERNKRSISPPPQRRREEYRRSPSPCRNNTLRRNSEPGRYKRDRDCPIDDRDRDSRNVSRREERDRPVAPRRDTGSGYRDRERDSGRREVQPRPSQRDARRPERDTHRDGRRDTVASSGGGVRYRDDHDRRGEPLRRPTDSDKGDRRGDDGRERYAAFSRASSSIVGRRRRPRSPEQWLNDRFLNGDGEQKDTELSTIVDEKEIDRRPKSAKIVIRDLYADNFNEAFEVVKTAENEQTDSSNEAKTVGSTKLKPEKSVDEE